MFSRRLLDYCSAAVAPIDALAGGLVQLFFSGLGQPRAASNFRCRPAGQPRSEPDIRTVFCELSGHASKAAFEVSETQSRRRRAVYEECGPRPACVQRETWQRRLGPLRAKRDPTRRSRGRPARAHIRRAARALTTMDGEAVEQP